MTTPYKSSFKVKPRLDHLRVFESIWYAHIGKTVRTKLEAKKTISACSSGMPKTRRDSEFTIWSRTRSVNLNEREVNGIYETTSTDDSKIIHVTKTTEDSALPELPQQPTDDEPMASVEESAEDIEMDNVESEEYFGQKLTTYRRLNEINGEWQHDYPPATRTYSPRT
ncbi:polyprotein [Phytophthora megakarya]|uniref:Polyprotein n=1 Tax=Phytophthora megakarya TaxID=4795 RepID=A0A225WYX2_9STRA|nr:polyprotein [Phytophthora megakarya]